MYQFIEGRVVMIADHLCLPLGLLLGVRSQTCNHVGVRVRAVRLFLLKRGAKTINCFWERTHLYNTLFNAANDAMITAKQTHNVPHVFYQNWELRVRVRNVQLDLRTDTWNRSSVNQCQEIITCLINVNNDNDASLIPLGKLLFDSYQTCRCY